MVHGRHGDQRCGLSSHVDPESQVRFWQAPLLVLSAEPSCGLITYNHIYSQWIFLHAVLWTLMNFRKEPSSDIPVCLLVSVAS